MITCPAAMCPDIFSIPTRCWKRRSARTWLQPRLHTLELLGDSSARLRARDRGLLGMYRFECRCDLTSLGLRHFDEHAAAEVRRAAMGGRVGEHLGDVARHGGGLVAGKHPFDI